MHKSDTDAKQRALTARIELQRASVDLDARSQSSICAGRRLASAAEAVAGAVSRLARRLHKERMPDERMSDARSTWRTAVESQAEETEQAEEEAAEEEEEVWLTGVVATEWRRLARNVHSAADAQARSPMTSLVTSIVRSAAARNAAPERAEEEAVEEAKALPSADARAAIEARRKLRAAELRAIEAQAAADVAQQQARGRRRSSSRRCSSLVPPNESGGGESERVLGGHATPDYGYLSDDQQDNEPYGEGCDELRQASACHENNQAEEAEEAEEAEKAEEATGGVELAIVGRAVPIHRVDLSPLAFEALVETVQEEEEAAEEEEGAPEAAEHVKLTKPHVSRSIHKELMSSEAFSSLIVDDSVAVGEEGDGERVNVPELGGEARPRLCRRAAAGARRRTVRRRARHAPRRGDEVGGGFADSRECGRRSRPTRARSTRRRGRASFAHLSRRWDIGCDDADFDGLSLGLGGRDG